MPLGGGKNFRRQRPNAAVVARTLNRPIESQEAMTRATPAPGIVSGVLAGVPFERALIQGELRARITGGGSGGKYAWRGIWGYPGHFHDLPERISGTVDTDPAYEANGNSTIATDTIVTLAREPASGVLVFQYDRCT